MRFIIALLRLIAALITIVGIFTCVIIIGFIIIQLAVDIFEYSDKLERKYFGYNEK